MVKSASKVKNRISMFLNRGEPFILVAPFVRWMSKSAVDPIYCGDSNPLLKAMVRHIAKKYKVKFSPDTRFIAVKEQFIDGEYTFYRDFLPSRNDVVVDIGAETGDYALLCACYYGCSKVYAFEPEKSSFRTLIENIELNTANDTISPFNCGISSENASVHASFNGDSISWLNEHKDHLIEVKKLDSFDIREISILKIDAEGNEVEVLNGAVETIKRCRPRIIIETHSKHLREEVVKKLGDLGYSLTHMGRTTLSRSNAEISNLFFSPATDA